MPFIKGLTILHTQLRENYIFDEEYKDLFRSFAEWLHKVVYVYIVKTDSNKDKDTMPKLKKLETKKKVRKIVEEAPKDLQDILQRAQEMFVLTRHDSDDEIRKRQAYLYELFETYRKKFYTPSVKFLKVS
jgi:hypothetical protein